MSFIPRGNYTGERRPEPVKRGLGKQCANNNPGSVAKAEAAKEEALAKEEQKRADAEALQNCKGKLSSLLGKLLKEDPTISAILSKILQKLNAEMSKILEDTKISKNVIDIITQYNSKNTDVSVVTVESLVVSIMKSVQRDEILIILVNMDAYYLRLKLQNNSLDLDPYYKVMGSFLFYLVKGLIYSKTVAFLKKKIKENKDYNFGMLEVVKGYLAYDHINLYKSIKCTLRANGMDI